MGLAAVLLLPSDSVLGLVAVSAALSPTEKKRLSCFHLRNRLKWSYLEEQSILLILVGSKTLIPYSNLKLRCPS